ncbi:hypothetical protein COT95_02200, partial [Candidatus Falkowbacteria bacterium CG10_big_fil_rev_8_21_14_0_10_37_6]
AVRVNIESVRVGQMTDWEKLIIDIKTDGTLTYEEAFKQAVDILVEQFNFLQENAANAVEDQTVKNEKSEESEDEQKSKKIKKSKSEKVEEKKEEDAEVEKEDK